MDLAKHNLFADDRTAAAGGFRPLSWPELCARIGASQQLRAAMSERAAVDTSFSAASAARLAAMTCVHLSPEAGVNPILSATGKSVAPTTATYPVAGEAGLSETGIAGPSEDHAQVRNDR